MESWQLWCLKIDLVRNVNLDVRVAATSLSTVQLAHSCEVRVSAVTDMAVPAATFLYQPVYVFQRHILQALLDNNLPDERQGTVEQQYGTQSAESS
jgi:hypothetical protein